MPSLQPLLDAFLNAWPKILAFDLGRYVIASTLMALVLAVFWRAGLARRKIQSRQASWADIRREIATSVRTAIIFSLNGFVIHLAVTAGIMTVYVDFSEQGLAYWLASLAFMLVAHDTWFYWTHRLIHDRRLFRRFHRTHHLSRTPTPFAAYAFDVPEAMINAVFMPLYLLVVPMHVSALMAFMTVMIVRNVMGHAGVELHTRGWLDSPLTRWISTTTHHDLHHAEARWNYGLYFTWWDRLMGTEHPQYAERFRAAVGTAGEAAARGRLAALLLAGLILLPLADAVAETPSPIGEWATEGHSARVLVEPCGEEGRLCGRITWLWQAQDASGRPVADQANPDPSRRSQPVLGAVILQGFQPAPDGSWTGGTVYNPEDGRTYSARLRLAGTDGLEVAGCVWFVCQTRHWRRVESICPSAARAQLR